MTSATTTRIGMRTLGLAGIAAVAACTPAHSGPDADTLGQCYRDVQKAKIAVQVAGAEIAPSDRLEALDALETANQDVILAWANREGVNIQRSDVINETPNGTVFINGIEAEAGLSGQAVMNELSRASDAPDQWRMKFDAALECAEQVSS